MTIIFENINDQTDFLNWLDDVLVYLDNCSDINYDEGVFVPNKPAALASEYENRYKKIIKMMLDNKTDAK